MAQTNGELLKATRDLTKQVEDLSGRLSAKELLHRRTRMLTIVAIFIAVLSVIGLGISAYTIKVNADNARTTCENANETRAAQRAIWDFVYVANERDVDTTAQDREEIQHLRRYTDTVFAERDCDDLSKKYDLPEPPHLPN